MELNEDFVDKFIDFLGENPRLLYKFNSNIKKYDCKSIGCISSNHKEDYIEDCLHNAIYKNNYKTINKILTTGYYNPKYKDEDNNYLMLFLRNCDLTVITKEEYDFIFDELLEQSDILCINNYGMSAVHLAYFNYLVVRKKELFELTKSKFENEVDFLKFMVVGYTKLAQYKINMFVDLYPILLRNFDNIKDILPKYLDNIIYKTQNDVYTKLFDKSISANIIKPDYEFFKDCIDNNNYQLIFNHIEQLNDANKFNILTYIIKKNNNKTNGTALKCIDKIIDIINYDKCNNIFDNKLLEFNCVKKIVNLVSNKFEDLHEGNINELLKFELEDLAIKYIDKFGLPKELKEDITPLMISCQKKLVKVIPKLINHFPNKIYKNHTALMYAINNKLTSVAIELIDNMESDYITMWNSDKPGRHNALTLATEKIDDIDELKPILIQKLLEKF